MALQEVNSTVRVRNTRGAGARIAHLAIGYALLLTAIWTTRPAQLWWSLAAAVWIVFSVVRLGRSAQELGLRFTNFRPSAWIITAAAVLACIASAIALVAGTFHPLFGLLPQIPHSLMYASWALQQEFILQCFFFLELESLLGTRRAVVAAALLFSAAHLPNPVLTATTLLMALFFVAAFARYRNLYALALAHAILGLALAVTVPDDIHRHMRVGIGYLHYRSTSHNAQPLR